MKYYIYKNQYVSLPATVKINVFNNEKYLNSIYKDWYSILVRDQENLFFKTIIPISIKNERYFDAMDVLGYPDLFIDSENKQFINKAIQSYSNCCKELGIIAELMRFDPLDNTNLLKVKNTSNMSIVYERPISYIPLKNSKEEQILVYTPSCKRRVKMGEKLFDIFMFNKTSENLGIFINIYYASLRRVNAESFWFFSPEQLSCLFSLPNTSIWVARQKNSQEIVSSALVLKDKTVAYSLLFANNDLSGNPGANEALLHEVAYFLSKENIKYFCLGGGRSSDLNDSLHKFKKKFTGNVIRNLPLGFIIHNDEVYKKLCNKYHLSNPSESLNNKHPFNSLINNYFPYRTN